MINVPPWPSAARAKARGDVTAEESNGGGAHAVAHAQGAAGPGCVRRIAERRLGTEADLGKVDAVQSPEPGDRAGKERRIVEEQRAVGAAECHLAAVGDIDFQYRAVGDAGAGVAGLLRNDWRIGDQHVAVAVIAERKVPRGVGADQHDTSRSRPVDDGERAAGTLTGGGKVVLSADTHNRIVGNGPGETLSNVNNTIAGAGTIGGGQLALVNSGTINANTAAALTIDTGGNTIVNTGLMETTAAGGLDIKSDVSNGGTLAASAGLLKLEGSVTGSGTTVIAGGGSVEIAAANGTEKVVFGFGATGRLILDHSSASAARSAASVPAATISKRSTSPTSTRQARISPIRPASAITEPGSCRLV